MPDRCVDRERVRRGRDDQAPRKHQRPGARERSPPMNRLKLATVWLDGCSGCHMSLLDIDAAIIDVAGKADLVCGPLVDAQEFPEGVDVTLVEGAVSSQEDLKKLQKIRSRTRTLVALGDCAVTSNVSAMRNGLPVQKMLQSIYIEGVSAAKGGPTDGRPALLPQADLIIVVNKPGYSTAALSVPVSSGPLQITMEPESAGAAGGGGL